MQACGSTGCAQINSGRHIAMVSAIAWQPLVSRSIIVAFSVSPHIKKALDKNVRLRAFIVHMSCIARQAQTTNLLMQINSPPTGGRYASTRPKGARPFA